MTQVIAPDGLFDSTEYAYSQARIEADTLYISGQVGVDEDLTVLGGITRQTRQAFDNLATILAEVDRDLDDIAKITAYVVDLADHIDGYRTAWQSVFDAPFPCHTLIGVDQLSPIADAELIVELDVEVPLDA